MWTQLKLYLNLNVTPIVSSQHGSNLVEDDEDEVISSNSVVRRSCDHLFLSVYRVSEKVITGS